MLVKELIELLNKQDPEMKVVARGYENGYDDIEGIEIERVILHEDASWYDGDYINDDKGEEVVSIR